MENAFPNQLEIGWEAVPRKTEGTVLGTFEVILVESGKILHSKLNGEGEVDTDAKLEKIIKGIKKALHN